jgi:hypothetical protein
VEISSASIEAYHVECIGHQREGVDSKADTQLKQKEDGVEDEHHLDARRL